MKKTFLALALALTASLPVAAQAQTAGDLGSGSICTLSDISGFIATRCSGFWEGNIVKKDAPQLPDGTLASVLTSWGYTPLPNIVEKNEYKNTETATFSTTMYGKTVVAFHWGNYGNVGNASSVYEFDFGNTGVNAFSFPSGKGLSNGMILYTSGRVDCVPGECCLQTGENCNPVPEPNSYLLMASGLAGLGYLARRRRSQA